MGAYMYPITVKRKKQKVKFVKHIQLPYGLLTLSDISKHLLNEGEKFSIDSNNEDVFEDRQTLVIFRERLETDEERDLRVNKELSYMAEYNKRHNK